MFTACHKNAGKPKKIYVPNGRIENETWSKDFRETPSNQCLIQEI
jgi:hypothetical protein